MMTRVRTAVAVVLAGAVLGVSGCDRNAPGTDGDLFDGWQPLAAPGAAEPGTAVPRAGMCLDSPTRTPFDPGFVQATPIECERGHALEVVLVGTVDGSAAQAAEPPAAGSEAFQAAYAACSTAVSDYVGGDWHTGMLGIDVQVPNRDQWREGRRAYVCTVFTSTNAMGVMSLTSASLKGSLAGSAPQAIRCLAVNGTKAADGWWDRVYALAQIDCAKPHGAEFVGTVQLAAGGALPAEEVLEDWSVDRCNALIAKYLGITADRFEDRADIGVFWDVMDQNRWNSGDRHRRCFALFYPGKNVRASIKGLGTKALPV